MLFLNDTSQAQQLSTTAKHNSIWATGTQSTLLPEEQLQYAVETPLSTSNMTTS